MAQQQATTRNIDLSEMFDSVVETLRSDRDYLNELDGDGGNGDHGDNALYNFETVRDAIRQQPNAAPAEQLRQAAEILDRQGKGATARIYARGLRDASQEIGSANSFGPEQVAGLLQGLLGGARAASGANEGEGTLLDALVPGVMGFLNARTQGMDTSQAIMAGLGQAMRGSRRLQRQPASYGRSRTSYQKPWLDPGAASAVSLLEGLFRSTMGR